MALPPLPLRPGAPSRSSRDAGGSEDGTEAPAAILALRLLLLTGCRKSEILGLRWDGTKLQRLPALARRRVLAARLQCSARS
jgi:hypothetical protein